MNDLMQSQIRESCKLALPLGLQELMSDISREVLRSQPENLYQFITDYLEALLKAREVLSIACRICGDVSKCSCQPSLEDELRRIGLSDEDTAKAKNIILRHFDKGQVQESNLLVKLSARTSMTEEQLVDVQKAVQKSFQRQMTKPKDLQVSFAMAEGDSAESTPDSSVYQESAKSSVSDFYRPSIFLDDRSTPDSQPEDEQVKEIMSPAYEEGKRSVSATTLAGSYVQLPSKVPYSVHNSDNENILVKSEKSVLSLLKSLLLTDEAHSYRSDAGSGSQRRDHGSRVEKEDLEAMRSILSLDIRDVRSRSSKESQGSKFRAIQENLHESSSGGS